MTFYGPILLILLQMPHVFAVSVNEAVAALKMFIDTLFKDKNHLTTIYFKSMAGY